MIIGQTVETVSTFKYLGTVVYENLTFTDNVDHIQKGTKTYVFAPEIKELQYQHTGSAVGVEVFS